TELSFEINNIIASPSFRFWATGLPLSAETLYKGNAKSGSKGKSKSAAQKKVPVSIFYIAHLTGNERMFMVTLLLNEILYWIRTQPGSGNLKYLLYMDEIFGYLPPYPQNPPSKTPLLLMLKQARAFGLGLVLATQNPKDIDYKALTNMGTWFIGKLQADGDRERILEGLLGITMKSGKTVGKKQLKEIMTSLNNRKFLVKNVHSKGLSLFQTRWAMSYLAGPLTRDQLKILVKERKRALKQKTLPGTGAPQKTLDSAQTTSQTKTNRTNKSAKKGPHLLPFIPEPGIPLENFFDNNAMQGHYSPCLYLDGEVIFDDNRHGLYIRKKYFVSTPLAASVNWRKATIEEKEIPYSLDPTETAGYLPYPVKIDYKLIKRLSTSFKNFLFTNLSVELLSNKDLNLLSGIDESKQAFQLKCRDVVEKMIDRDVEKIKESYSKKIRRLRDRAQREELKIEKLEEEQKSKRNEELFSAGETVLGFLLGGKSRRGLSSAARKRRATTSAANKVRIGKTKLQQLNEQLLELREELEDKVADIEDKFYEKADNITTFEVRLEKNDIIISNQAILWKLLNK
ncbi:MAG: ATP-binding protein, partial [bacterium]|nr:ATP-binding protein [bacterium]